MYNIPYSFDYNSHSISVRIRLVFAIFRNFSEKKTNSVRTRLVFAMKIGFVSFDLTFRWRRDPGSKRKKEKKPRRHLLVYLNLDRLSFINDFRCLGIVNGYVLVSSTIFIYVKLLQP